jgi:hypothetical protein
MTEPVKLCKDCRWAVNLVGDRQTMLPPAMYFQCHHPSSAVTGPPDLVAGREPEEAWNFCSHNRATSYGGRCGPEGLFWEPIEVGFSGVIGFGEALTSGYIEPDPVRRLKDITGWVIEQPDEDDEGGWEWVPLSARETGLPFKIDICEVGPIVVARKEGHLTRAEMNDLYRWIALNAEALIAHQKGEIDALQFCERLRKL